MRHLINVKTTQGRKPVLTRTKDSTQRRKERKNHPLFFLANLATWRFKYFFLLILLLMLPTVSFAQFEGEANPGAPVEEQSFIFTIEVDSALVRALPTTEAEPVASVFENDELEVFGRNLDGTWFEVRRPGRLYNLGWIFNEMGSFDFRPEYLPLTDMVTGVVGPSPLLEDPGIAVFVLDGAALRAGPFQNGRLAERIGTVPPSTTVPLLERNQNGSWLHVNYLGYDGWIAGFVARSRPDILDVPLAPNLAPLEELEVIIIPPELQRAQVARLREYTEASSAIADQLTNFWQVVSRGETMPCNAPPFISEYLVSQRDVQELPELQRYIPRLSTARDSLNAAIDPLYTCGVLDREVVSDARNSAINAAIIFRNLSRNLDQIESLIR